VSWTISCLLGCAFILLWLAGLLSDATGRTHSRLPHPLLPVQTDGFAIAMPVTGVAMGYFGGKGVPFFGTTFAPASGEMGKAKDGKLAGKAYKLHKQIGWYFKWFIPVHVGAVGVHA